MNNHEILRLKASRRSQFDNDKIFELRVAKLIKGLKK
jgi:hypothetical protein